jgi:hypothetical protein
MNWDEYNKLFHELQLNLVAFKPLMQCDQEVLKLVNAAVEAEREACATLCDKISDEDGFEGGYAAYCADMIRARSNSEVS